MQPRPDVLNDLLNSDRERHNQFNKERKNYLIATIVTTLVISLGFPIAIDMRQDYWLSVLVSAFTFGVLGTATGFSLGLIAALFSNRGFSYGKRYLNASLMMTIVLHLLFSLLAIAMFIFQ